MPHRKEKTTKDFWNKREVKHGKTLMNKFGFDSKKLFEALGFIDDFDYSSGDPNEPDEEDHRSIEVPSWLGSELMNWNEGQGSAIYAVASSSIAGKAIDAELIKDALWDLEDFYASSNDEDARAELDDLILNLNDLLQ